MQPLPSWAADWSPMQSTQHHQPFLYFVFPLQNCFFVIFSSSEELTQRSLLSSEAAIFKPLRHTAIWSYRGEMHRNWDVSIYLVQHDGLYAVAEHGGKLPCNHWLAATLEKNKQTQNCRWDKRAQLSVVLVMVCKMHRIPWLQSDTCPWSCATASSRQWAGTGSLCWWTLGYFWLDAAL